MNKTSKFFLGFASLSMLAACSSDEPAQEVVTPGAGETAYLTVTLRDANDLSRAGKPDSSDPVDGEFDYGTDNEAMVNIARFYFFDKDGIYAGQSNLYNGGNASTATPDENIEFKSPTLVVLENQKSNEYPKYMVTVLNGAQFTNDYLTGKTLADFSKELTNWGSNTENGFVMASTSYFMATDDKNHDNTYYYATVLDSSNFARTPEAAKAEGKPVDVYVERLASRIHLASAQYFDVQATIFGADGDNPDAGNNEAATKLKVRIDGWYINGTQVNTYLLKQLAGWSATSNIASTSGTGFWNWNAEGNHRSYWGQSVNYGSIGETLTFLPYANPNVKGAGAFDYCNENTSTKTDLAAGNNDLPNQQKLTSVILKATVGTVDEAGDFKEGIYLVQHNGAYFTKDRFIKYAAEIAKAKMPYTCEFVQTGEVDGKPAGDYIYTPLFDAETILNYIDLDGTNEQVWAAPIEGKITGDLYTVDKNAFDLDAYAAALKGVSTNIETVTRAFNGGAMYYNIPIAHLNSPKYDSNGDLSTWEEGSFGVVRNHSYEVKINSIKRLGQGVFNPEDNTTPIKPDPDPKDPNWYLGATINILSWKIVSNNVDL